MTIDTDVVITINLSELVNIRSVSLDTEMSMGQIEDLANELRLTLTWDTLYGMVDDAILDYLDRPNPNRPHYGEISPPPGWEAELVRREKDEKERKKYFEENYEMVDLVAPAWTIQVPRRKDR